ncbi:hypothetical protein EDC19_1448 [Natranaerovirga hydrolytica]|uniref:Membrane transport protein n=1 Tax=Natranaerovirga hydrolytica TaxID=680378 RepID=A0A4R1ML02_9FIRM|nr:malate permease [Natranaerovirga hydrolytica]TCK93257.1 hypothetical protein EDC19_1448 [Natranaerovirga hydrolytica]
MDDIISRVIPILALIFIGYIINKKSYLSQTTVNELKKGIVNVALPAVLLITFMTMELRAEYFWVAIGTFFLLTLLYIAGALLEKVKGVGHPILPFILSTFTFGLLGIPLFNSVFGIENLDKLSVLGIGHEFFVWFVMLTLLKMKFNGEGFSFAVIKGFAKSPLILSIVLGLFINILSINIILENNPLFNGIMNTIEYFSVIATPIILIIVGYGLKLDPHYVKDSIRLVGLRIGVIFVIGYIIKSVLLNPLMGEDPMFDHAFFTFLILPPPLSMPLFIGENSTQEHSNLANNVVVLNTIVTIIIFIVYVLMMT